MATAPRPGSRAEAEAARQFIRLRVKDREMDLMMSLTIQERFVIRAATAGLPFEAFLPQQSEREFGEDSLFVLWWIARRQNGEPNLAFAQFANEWTAINAEGFDLDIVDDDGEDQSPEE